MRTGGVVASDGALTVYVSFPAELDPEDGEAGAAARAGAEAFGMKVRSTSLVAEQVAEKLDHASGRVLSARHLPIVAVR